MVSDPTKPSRWDAFAKALEAALSGIFKRFTWAKIRDIFPKLMNTEMHKRDTKAQHTALEEYFQARVREDLQEVFSKYQLADKLEILENAIERAQARNLLYEEAGHEISKLDPKDRPIDLAHLSPRDLMACYSQNIRMQKLSTMREESIQLDQRATEIEMKISDTEQDVERMRAQIRDTCNRINSFHTGVI